eukprot:gnl/Spiro4/21039_TR10265_c0_g1_i1.p1 gnl/Spiro4/21039_TR10265_c0_g1~~gnl/Spiro4/21039_TR10265_c0_g1_i1.p1  ORF type:complete len:113 (+),score=23.43 gnl/Spiro4/21039_TR10265_c0_g1_i1:48-386(+)
MSAESQLQVLNDMWRARQAHDNNTAISFFTDDAVMITPTMLSHDTHNGKAAILACFNSNRTSDGPTFGDWRSSAPNTWIRDGTARRMMMTFNLRQTITFNGNQICRSELAKV